MCTGLIRHYLVFTLPSPHLFLLVTALVLGPSLARSDSHDLMPPTERWYLSGRLGFDLEIEERKAFARGTIDARSATSELSTPAFSLGLQANGPPLRKLWNTPRPVAWAGVKFLHFTSDLESGNYSHAGPESELTSAQELPTLQDRFLGFLSFDAAANSGFEVDFRNSPVPALYSGIGLDFDWATDSDAFPVWITLKPGIEYSVRRYTLRGGLVQVDEVIGGAPIRYAMTRQQDTESFWEHRAGPSLEAEVGLRDRRRFALALYLGARLQFLLSREVQTWGNSDTITTTIWTPNSVLPGNSTGKVVRFKSEAQPILYSVGIGIRFYWFGGH